MKHSEHKSFTIYNASCLDVMDSLPENSIDAIVTDPPYEIDFMGKGWDRTGIVFDPNTWKKCLRVLKEGGHMLAFNHSRTFHRMAVAIEDAGFEIRDTIMWLYGSGFPKSHNIAIAIDKKMGLQEHRGKGTSFAAKTVNGKVLENGKEVEQYEPKSQEAQQWEGWGTALKPAVEMITLARKPFKGTIADNVLKHGVGGLNIDECRVKTDELKNKVYNNKGDNLSWGGTYGMGVVDGNAIGRFPANVIHDGSDEVVDLFPDVGGGNYKEPNARQRKGFMLGNANGSSNAPDNYGDSGSAARFFYTAKAQKKDRDEGLAAFEAREVRGGGGRVEQGYDINNEEEQRLRKAATAYGAVKAVKRNVHPTVKPTDLMQYLVRLITPKGGTVLDPFMGSGSTGKAAMIENNERDANYHFIGIDLEAEYCDIAKARILFGVNYFEEKPKADGKIHQNQVSLFELE